MVLSARSSVNPSKLVLLAKAPVPTRQPRGEELFCPPPTSSLEEETATHGVINVIGPGVPLPEQKEEAILLDLASKLSKTRAGSMQRELETAAQVVVTFPPEWLLRRAGVLRSLLAVLQASEPFALAAADCLYDWANRLASRIDDHRGAVGAVHLHGSALLPPDWDLTPFDAAVEILEVGREPIKKLHTLTPFCASCTRSPTALCLCVCIHRVAFPSSCATERPLLQEGLASSVP